MSIIGFGLLGHSYYFCYLITGKHTFSTQKKNFYKDLINERAKHNNPLGEKS